MQMKILAAIGILGIAAAVQTSQAATLYQDNGSSSAVVGYNGVANGNGLQGYGDDYNTGTTGTVLTGLTFTGGFSASDTVDQLKINFYNSAQTLVNSVVVSNAEVQGNSASHTLSAADFGTGVSIPGSGYFIFAPFNTTGTTPQFGLNYSTTSPGVGTSLSTNAKTDDNGAFTVGNNVFGFGAVPYAIVELDGTGTPAPEPASMGLLAAGTLLLLRRRRRHA